MVALALPLLGRISFGAPLWLVSFYAILTAAVFQYLAARRRRELTVEFSGTALLATVAPRARRRRAVGPALVFTAGVLASIAAASPALVRAEPRRLVLALDVSNSMAATDLEPSRLEVAKADLDRFIATAPEDLSLGLIVFDRAVRTSLAVGTDRAELRAALDEAQLSGGSAVGDAILVAFRSAATAGGGQVLVVADGTTTDGVPGPAAALRAAEVGIPVSTVALGTAVASVTVGAQTVDVPVATEELAGIAAASGGRAYKAATPAALASVLDTVLRRVEGAEHKTSLAGPLAGIATLLLAAGLIASSRWSLTLP